MAYKNGYLNGDFKKPLTPEQRAQAAAEGVSTNENDIPDPNTNRTGYFNGTGFGSQLGNYGVDLLTGGPARRLAGYAANGDWSNFGAQAGNMGGTPYGAHVFGQADGQVLAPNSGAFNPASTRADSAGEFVGRAGLGVIGGVSGVAAAQGLGNLATGGDKSGGVMGGSNYSNDINGAADQITEYGKQAAGMYGQARDRALGYYGNANSAYDQLYGGGSQPAGQQPQGAGVSDLSKGGYSLSGSPNVKFNQLGGQQPTSTMMNGNPTQSRDYYSAVTARNSGPTNAQAYYDAYKPVTYNQDYYSQRAATGYGTNDVADRYQQRAATANQPGQLESRLGDLSNWANDPNSSAVGGTMSNLQSYSPDAYAEGAQQRITGGSSDSGQMIGDIRSGTTGSGQMISRLSNGQGDTGRLLQDMRNEASPTGQLQSSLRNNQGDSAQLLGEMRGGTSATGQMENYLKSGQSSTGQFLAGFDPTKNAGLTDTYGRIAADGPQYEEDFYTSQMNGTNPAFNQLKADYLKDTQRASAARGGFVAGHSMDAEQRGLSRLTNEEFANRGKLAEAAGGAHRASLGQQLSGAQALDNAYLGRQSLQAQTGLGRDNQLAGLATARENNMSGLATSREGLMGSLASNRENNMSGLSLGREATIADLTKSGDSLRAGLSTAQDAQYNDLAMNRDATGMAKQSLLGQLSNNFDANDIDRRGLEVNAAGQVDTNNRLTQADIDQLAGASEASSFARQRQLDDLAGRGGAEAMSNSVNQGNFASSADASNLGRDTMLGNQASNASAEQRNAAKDKFDAAMRTGDAQSAISSAMDAAAIGALTESQIAALNARLAALGVSAAERKAATEQLAGLAGKGIDMLKGYFDNRSSSGSSTPVAGDGKAGGYIGS